MLNKAIIEGRAILEYIICDGGSTDGTLARIDSALNTVIAGNNVGVGVFSEPDKGLYDALSKGLSVGNGDIFAYINAGDYYSPHAFDIVMDLFSRPSIHWLSGLHVHYNEQSHIVKVITPYKYRSRLVQAGFYGTMLPFIMQETVFWKAGLNQLLDVKKLAEYRLAGDYYLWKKFSEKAELNIVSAWLGGFRYHRGQISGDMRSYRKELKSIADVPKFSDYIIAAMDYLCWYYLPPRQTKNFNRKTFYKYDHSRQEYI